MSKKAKVFLILFALSVALGVAFKASVDFSEFYTVRISPIFRVPLSMISSLLPFSLAEALVVILAFLLVVTALSGLKMGILRLLKKDAVSHFSIYLKIVLYSVAFIWFTYAFAFESSYSRKPVNEALGFELVEMNTSNVSEALDKVTEELVKTAEELENTSRLELTFNQIADEVLKGAKKASEKHPIYQGIPFRAKPLAFSKPLAYTGISGIYSFFTGEANINTAFSDYSIPFTVAHEYSHQLGIGSEKEAEFSALLICLESDNPYVRYSAYSQVAITLSNILFELDEEAFYNAFRQFPHRLVTDIYLSSQRYQKYSETVADEIAEAINDTYLSLSGDEGVISYSLSSQLYVAYFLKE
ncbi:MAG: DUF3810 domain-containing protein [Clostridia bacterium]|nr:DUF3810 domain-containing protein [Clostridia bacterium]